MLASVKEKAPARKNNAAPKKRNRAPRKPISKKPKVNKLKKPKRPKTAYNYFQLSERKKVFEGSAGTNVHDEKFARNIGAAWKSLSPQERAHYQEMSDRDRERYERENRAYILQLAGKVVPEKKIPTPPPSLPSAGEKRALVQDLKEQDSNKKAKVDSIPKPRTQTPATSHSVNMPEDFDVDKFELDFPEGSSSPSTDELEISTADELEIPTLPSPVDFKGLQKNGNDLLSFERSTPNTNLFDTALIDDDTALVNSMFAF